MVFPVIALKSIPPHFFRMQFAALSAFGAKLIIVIILATTPIAASGDSIILTFSFAAHIAGWFYSHVSSCPVTELSQFSLPYVL